MNKSEVQKVLGGGGEVDIWWSWGTYWLILTTFCPGSFASQIVSAKDTNEISVQSTTRHYHPLNEPRRTLCTNVTVHRCRNLIYRPSVKSRQVQKGSRNISRNICYIVQANFVTFLKTLKELPYVGIIASSFRVSLVT